ncbi:UDP-N-acetylmuramate dehydrogenase [Gordonia sp. HY002]|uniref:UDP-N-acetylmuramate dehydrogenase n=1 Tax=Gordonia zhenghanii TaxID=2911516 RepID=UPI001EF0C307|nr:UDP-N-acetylmuramate dehydrogenase [Gordonia zhenghanii]MCF8569037.1 UDP-N-acetylmuramate dehydrogenase [Gordonia zhenghanii]MCF8605253.1 UDP-N-acetylmuramate dehydrogenase [Gordonia zhenghanii]
MTHAQPLSAFTTLRLGGPADAVVDCTDTDALIDTVTALDRAGTPVLLIAGGSNLVIGDDGFAGTAVVIATDGVEFGSDDAGPYVTAQAGADWDSLVAATIDAGFGGLECLSGIPGAAGTTPVQNVGAYGVEVGDLLRAVRLLDRATGDTRWAGPDELALGYRTSNLKGRDDHVVLAVSLRLNDGGTSQPIAYRELARRVGVDEGATAPAVDIRATVLELRRSKGMVLDADDHDTWSAGSFFTNPIVGDDAIDGVLDRIRAVVGDDAAIPQFPADGGSKLSAGWLIERAGFTRGYPSEDAAARLSTKHTLALTNRGAASTADLVALAGTVRRGVLERFGVELHPEPVFVNCSLPR